MSGRRIAGAALVGARGFDCVTSIDVARAARLRAAGFDFGVRYLGSLTNAEIDAMHAADLSVMPCTYGGAFDGHQAVAHAQEAGIPPGVTIWLDVEGQGGVDASADDVRAAMLVAKVNAFAAIVRGAGYDPAIYVGAGALLTSAELFALAVDRYWHSMSRVVDRRGALAEPSCGWCMHQLFPTVLRGGTNVDINIVGQDFMGRLPTWCQAAV